MPKVTFIQYDGSKSVIDAESEYSLMNVAQEHDIPGIDADCGGSCSCATCHVYVDEKWMEKLGHPKPDEEALLSLSPERKPNSRLSCQINISDKLDGLIIHLPEFQF